MTGQSRLESPSFSSAADLLASIVVPCRGQLEYTRLCLPRILRHTRAPFELLFLDLGSLDGTVDYLSGAVSAAAVPMQASFCAEDVDFPAMLDQTFDKLRGEFVVWLSNDTLVTPGWLDGLVSLARSQPALALVSPLTNWTPPSEAGVEPLDFGARGGQWVERYPISRSGEPEGIDDFSRVWREAHCGQWNAASELFESCFLAPAEVVRKLAPWSRMTPAAAGRSSLAHLEMEEVSKNVQRAGLGLAYCREVFVYSFGSRFSHPGSPTS